jgi:hypothetical protein
LLLNIGGNQLQIIYLSTEFLVPSTKYREESFRVSGFQGFRVSGFQGFRVSGFQGFRVSGFQGFRVSGFQGFKGTLPSKQL